MSNPDFRVQPGSLQPNQIEHINRWAVAAKDALAKADEDIKRLEALVSELGARRCVAELHIQRRKRAWLQNRQEAAERTEFLKLILARLDNLQTKLVDHPAHDDVSDALYDLTYDIECVVREAEPTSVSGSVEPVLAPYEHTFNNY
jgi:hypothetical protein